MRERRLTRMTCSERILLARSRSVSEILQFELFHRTDSCEPSPSAKFESNLLNDAQLE